MDADARKTALRMIPYGIYVLTADDGKGNIGAATVNWVTQGSFAPPLVVVGVKGDSGAHTVVKGTGKFVLNMLGKDQKGAAFTFFKPAKVEGGKLSGMDFHAGHNGAPVLNDAIAAVECSVKEIVALGDHDIVGEVTDAYVMKPPSGRADAAILEMKDWAITFITEGKQLSSRSELKGNPMFREFATVYPGHIDLPDHGQNATPANERRFSNEQLAGVFAKTEAVAKLMDRTGWDTLWMAEHHFQFEGYEVIPNLLLLAVHLCHLTTKLKIGCGFNIAPMWHPLRLAEDYAVADILTKGRTVFGVGRGYHSREVETFGAPILNQDANRELFEEQVEIIFKAFNNESFSHNGKHYTLPPEVPYRGYTLKELTLVPRPVNMPVETWQPVVSAGARGLDFMIKYGIKGAVGGGAATMREGPITAYREAAARAGIDLKLGENLMLGIFVHLADTKEKAVKELRPLYEEHIKMFAPLGFVPGATPAQVEAIARRGGWDAAGVPTLDHFMKLGSWFAGTPEELVAYLKELEARYPGMEHINLSTPMSAPESVMLEQLGWVAEAVMPKFKTR